MHFGGKRTSEVLQMWVGDVEPNRADPTRCIPWISHPTDGFADWVDPKTRVRKRLSRHEYLRVVYDRAPLVFETGRRRVGWKDPLLSNDNRMRVFWNDMSADRLFWTVYRAYLRERPIVARHPYLFITRGGDPMTVAAFEKVHAAGVRRIGLAPRKGNGTTPHGHRHAYGHVADCRGVGAKAIQTAFGHRSPLSQEIYKNRGDEEIAGLMSIASTRLTDCLNARRLGQ